MTLPAYRKILLTHDGSRLANDAVSHAISLAKAYRAQIVLLHVVHSIDQELAFYATPGMYPAVLGTAADGIVEENKKLALKKMTKIADTIIEQKIKVNVVVKDGSAQNLIVEVAKSQKCDLIVMSTHGRGGVGRAFLGSVTDHVIRNAHCPVFIVHPKK